MKHLRECDGCRKESDEEKQMSCCATEVSLDNFGVSGESCFDDQFYCPKCLNAEGFCDRCAKLIPSDVQQKIGRYLDGR